MNNAGIAAQKLFTDVTADEWDEMMAVHVRGAFLCCRAALPHMIRQKWGRIINIASMWGQVGASCEVPYSAAKAALIGLTKALAKEEGPSGVTVNCIAPGAVDTDMMAGFSAQDREALCEETPLCRLGTPQDIAAAAAFLASEQAGFYHRAGAGCERRLCGMTRRILHTKAWRRAAFAGGLPYTAPAPENAGARCLHPVARTAWARAI